MKTAPADPCVVDRAIGEHQVFVTLRNMLVRRDMTTVDNMSAVTSIAEKLYTYNTIGGWRE